MFSNSIKGRNTLGLLFCGFSLIIVLMVMLASVSLSQLRQSKERLDNIIHVHNEKSALIGAMQYANRERIINLQHMLITDDFFELDEAAQNNMRMANRFVQARRKLEAMPRAPGEEALLADLRAAAMKGAPLNDTVREMLLNEIEDSQAKARTILIEQVLPAQNRIYEVFDDLIGIYKTANAEAVSSSDHEYMSARSLILTMLKVTFLVGVGVALYVTVLIVRNERALEGHRDKLGSQVAERTRDLQRISTEAITARREAEEANNAKSTFMANMSHELRTPLNAVLGFSEIMQMEIMGAMPKAYKEYPGHINTSAKHLLQMIEQLLDLSRIEAGHLDLQESDIELSPLLEETVTVIRSAFSRDDSTLFIMPESVRLGLHVDARHLKQTLINIVSNACKFSGQNDPVTLSASVSDGEAVIVVRDRGIGIAEEDVARLFNPYERSEAQTARETEGTGLGLAISRSLIEAHGGTLTLDSVLDEGTVVTITLPSARVTRVDESGHGLRVA